MIHINYDLILDTLILHFLNTYIFRFLGDDIYMKRTLVILLYRSIQRILSSFVSIVHNYL
jgi:hypothetical protein